MAKTVKVKDLRAGMRVTEPILGKKKDIKVNKGEILSQGHVDKLNKWAGVDAANPKGISVETALGSGKAVPDIVDHPEKSHLIETAAKKQLHKSITVPVTIKDGKVIRDEQNDTAVQK